MKDIEQRTTHLEALKGPWTVVAEAAYKKLREEIATKEKEAPVATDNTPPPTPNLF